MPINQLKILKMNIQNLNLKRLDALMMIRFKQLGLDINFVNKFMAAVKGYVDGQKKEQRWRMARKLMIRRQPVEKK